MPKKVSQQLGYAELMQELNIVVGQLEQPDVDVDTAMKLYERGIELTKQLDTYLTKSEHRLTELNKLSRGTKG